MPVQNYQNFHFDDLSTSLGPTTGPLSFFDDGVKFTFSPVLTTFSFTLKGAAGTEGGTTVNPATLAGPSKSEGVLITAQNTPTASMTLTAGPGATFFGPGTPNAAGQIVLAFGGGMQPIDPGWGVALRTTGGNLVSGKPIPTTAPTLITPNIPAGVTVSGIRFGYGDRPNGALFLNGITASVSCFCAGTRIACPGGPRPVEDLAPGDRVLLAGGGETVVKRLGRQSIDARLRHPREVNPICISAGALGGGLPERDLRVSPDHGIALDGLLVNAGALVNGTTIRQQQGLPVESFTYFHVETDAHELLLAEGVPAETYLDRPSRDAFDNGAERADAPAIPEMGLPRIASARLLPARIKDRLRLPIAA